MTRRLDDALQAALDAVGRGESIDAAVIGLPPREAEDVRRLVAAAQAAAILPTEPAAPDAGRRSRTRFLRRAAALAVAPTRRPAWTLLPRASAAALAALVALGLGLGGLNEAAAYALPGDVLYPVKIAAADLRLRLEFEAGQRVRLEALYAEQRLADVRQLLALGRLVAVSFQGRVDSIGSVLWQVEGIPIRLTPATRFVGEIRPGMVVEVDGTTQADGTILADQLHLLSYDLLGTLEALEAGQVRVDGQVFLITPESHLEPGLAVGDRVLLRVALGDDGVAMVLSAVRFAPPTPTAPALPTSVPAPTRSAAPPATATPESTDDSPQAEPTQDETEEVEETPQETPPTEEDESEEEGDKIQFEGIVESIGGSQWIVAGRSLRVDGETEIKDDPQVGDTVKVVAFLQSDGTWWAEKIELED